MLLKCVYDFVLDRVFVVTVMKGTDDNEVLGLLGSELLQLHALDYGFLLGLGMLIGRDMPVPDSPCCLHIALYEGTTLVGTLHFLFFSSFLAPQTRAGSR